jgi:hypothetical protein
MTRAAAGASASARCGVRKGDAAASHPPVAAAAFGGSVSGGATVPLPPGLPPPPPPPPALITGLCLWALLGRMPTPSVAPPASERRGYGQPVRTPTPAAEPPEPDILRGRTSTTGCTACEDDSPGSLSATGWVLTSPSEVVLQRRRAARIGPAHGAAGGLSWLDGERSTDGDSGSLLPPCSPTSPGFRVTAVCCCSRCCCCCW